MPRRPEPLQTTRLLASGLFLWVIDAFVAIWNPTTNSGHVAGFYSIVSTLTLYGGLVFLLTGMFLRATAWAQSWRDGTDGPYEGPGDARVSERLDYPADDDPDF